MWCSGDIRPDDIAWKFIDHFLGNLHGLDVERESAFTVPILSARFLHQIVNFLLY